MANYFSIDPRGVGTWEMESLLSYWGRLAAAHGVTVSQLVFHMSEWARRRDWRFPEHLLYGRVLSMCSAGSDVTRAVAIIEAATGVTGLRASTLMPLAKVLAHRGGSSVKRSKAWCPRCYEDDVRAWGSAYDRLIWAIVPIERCSIHRLRLLVECPSCKVPQRFTHASGNLALCYRCGGNLIGSPSSWAVALSPSGGEDQIRDLVEHFALSSFQPVENAPRIYEHYAKQIRRSCISASVMRRTKHSQEESKNKVTFGTLLRRVLRDGANLVTLLTDPIGAVRQASVLSGFEMTFDAVQQLRRPKALKEHTKKLLEKALLDEAHPPLSVVCRSIGVSTGFARYHFPMLCKRVVKKFESRRHSVRATKIRRATAALLDAEWNKYSIGEIRSQDVMVANLAKRSGCSVRTARLLVATRVRGKRNTRCDYLRDAPESLTSGDGRLLNASDLAKIWKCKVSSASAKVVYCVRIGKLFNLVTKTSWVPAFQLDEHGRPRPIIAKMLNHLKPGMEFQFYMWMFNPNQILAGRRPFDVLNDSRSELLPDLVSIEFG